MFDNYNISLDIPVAWSDMDAFNHVNNTVYFRYFEGARIKYLEVIKFGTSASPTGIGPILASTSCRFKIPLTYPDTISAFAKVTHIGHDRFAMKFAVRSEKHGKLAAEGDGLIVSFDYDKRQKADLPADVVTKIKILDNLG